MNKPRKKQAGRVPVQMKTVFYTEGNPAAILIVNRLGNRTESVMEFPKAEVALDWCRRHGSHFVYSPINLAHG